MTTPTTKLKRLRALVKTPVNPRTATKEARHNTVAAALMGGTMNNLVTQLANCLSLDESGKRTILDEPARERLADVLMGMAENVKGE